MDVRSKTGRRGCVHIRFSAGLDWIFCGPPISGALWRQAIFCTDIRADENLYIRKCRNYGLIEGFAVSSRWKAADSSRARAGGWPVAINLFLSRVSLLIAGSPFANKLPNAKTENGTGRGLQGAERINIFSLEL